MDKKYTQQELEKLCKHISEREVLAQKAERESIRYMQTKFMEDKVGKVFDGVVTGVQDYGLFVEISDFKCEGLVRPDKISSIESYNMEPSSYRAVGIYSGNIIRLGDVVKVVVNNVDLERKTIDLSMVNFLK
jgi:ribonuclease R